MILKSFSFWLRSSVRGLQLAGLYVIMLMLIWWVAGFWFKVSIYRLSIELSYCMIPKNNNISKILDISRKYLIIRGMKLASAESCTGGLIAKLMTDSAGSSAYFAGAVVSYSNACKHSLLGVPLATIEEHGAVSEQTVISMVQGLFERTEADVAVSVSGVAGPGGGTEEKPVGTVWLCWGLRGDVPVARLYHFEGDRKAVRYQSAEAVLRGMLTLLQSD